MRRQIEQFLPLIEIQLHPEPAEFNLQLQTERSTPSSPKESESMKFLNKQIVRYIFITVPVDGDQELFIILWAFRLCL